MRKENDPLKQILYRFNGELHSLSEFIEALGKTLWKEKFPGGDMHFAQSDRNEFKEFMTFLKTAMEGKIKDKQHTIRSPRVAELVMAFVVPVKQKSLVAEMALIYVMAQMEGFLKDLLKAAFLLKPQALKSKRQLSYDEVLDYESMDDLVKYLSQREADDLGRGSIDTFEAYYQQKFNILLTEFPKWNVIREASFRRNICVHNSGIANEFYCKAVDPHAKGRQLSPSLIYLKDLLKCMRGFARYAYSNLKDKIQK